MLALGFLAKAVMLPLAGVFLTAAVLPSLRQRLVLPYALASVLAFLAFAGPYIFELSRKEGHLTAGEAGTLNYAWHVNGAPFVHWQGELPGLGTPKHPTRKILSSPQIYEFAIPLLATYPPWYDPSYWNEGLHARFDGVDQLGAFKANLGQFLRVFWSQGVLIASVLVLLAMRQMRRSIFKEYLAIWYVWAPALAAFVIYGVVWVEGRYLSQFLVLIWGAALILVRLPRGTESRRLIRAVVAVAVTLMGLRVAVNLVKDSVRGHHAAELQMQIAEGLAAKGLQEGVRLTVEG
jgi:hypothetical protein